MGKPVENYGTPWKTLGKIMEPLENYGKHPEFYGKPRKTMQPMKIVENYSSMEHSYFEKQKYLTITNQMDVSKSPYLLNDMCRSQRFFETWP